MNIADRDGQLARACGCIQIMHAEEARLRETASGHLRGAG